jgi:tRNA A-37 threonylcarbamoyl transferase component Bud32
MHKFCFYTEKAADQWFRYLSYAIPYAKFIKSLSSSLCDKKISKEVRDVHSELLETILKEGQETVEVEDGIPDINKQALNYIEENKSEDDEEPEFIPSSHKVLTTAEEELEKEKKKVQFSSLEVMNKIGKGAFGQVFKVKLKDNNKFFAMKSISKKFLESTKQLKYALSECKLLKDINYPFIIKMHYIIQTPEYLHLILDLCEGGDLSMHIIEKQMLEEQEAKFYVAELILAIEHLHSKNIIYRDLKPDNILLGNFWHTANSQGWTYQTL